jgi:ATP-dependent Clp protease ATP-binding subunit ClpB
MEIELAGLKREKGEAVQIRKNELEAKVSDLKKEVSALSKEWDIQKDILKKLQEGRKKMDLLKTDLERAERDVDLNHAAEIKYGKMPQLLKELQVLEAEWKQIPEDKRVLREEVTDEDIAEVIARWTGIPVTKLLSSEVEKLLHLEDELANRVVGQEEGISAVAKALKRNRAGLTRREGPIGSFLFLGPTGVGKTETAKALAEFMMGSEDLIIRIDMSEYQEDHSIARLIGSPPGYVGYEEGGQLTEAVRRKPYSVVLLDEIEKANPKIYNVMLQVLDDGRLTDGQGRVVNFKNTIIIMTSNIEPALLKKAFRPEFLNRLDATVEYKSLSPQMMERIVDIQLDGVRKTLSEQNMSLTVTQKAKTYLAQKGYDPDFGARPLRRLIQNEVLDELSLLLIENKLVAGDGVELDIVGGVLKIHTKLKN